MTDQPNIYMPAIGGPYPWTVLGVLKLSKPDSDPSIFATKQEALEWAQTKCDRLNKADQEELETIAKQWTGEKENRVCALCLCEVKRSTYNEHMQSHGYETLEIKYSPQSQSQ